MTPQALPRYAELPVVPGRPAGSSWGLWGDEDVLGTLNLLTEERIRQAAGLIRTGKVFSLALEFVSAPMPVVGGVASPANPLAIV